MVAFVTPRYLGDMSKILVTGLSVLGIVGTSSVAFATNMQALDLQASQDVSGGSSQVVPTSDAVLDQNTVVVPDPTATPPAAATPAPSTTPSTVSSPADDDTEPAETHTSNVNAATPAHATTGGSTVAQRPAETSNHEDSDDDDHESDEHESDEDDD